MRSFPRVRGDGLARLLVFRLPAALRSERKLAALPLTELGLSGTAVTDQGLAALHKLSGLQGLAIADCPGVTDAGVAAFKKTLPNCTVGR
ncbi:MAG TPA: hypothetical protein VEL76_26015 [Gemmataceae bacterium]|nr:hypothetical protein [Gemmataceae bacterium]